MAMKSLFFLSSIGLASCAATIVFDGRVPSTAVVADFDAAKGIFDPSFTKGQNLSFSQIVQFDSGNASLFDAQANAKSFAVTLSDKSIFAPGGSQPQSAVRRAELSPNSANEADVNTTSTGVKTVHFSVQPSATQALNTSHEYLMVFQERADFSANVFQLKTGTLIGATNGAAMKNNLQLLGNSKNGSQVLFSTPFTQGVFTNFAITMDFNKNTVQVFSSTGNSALKQQTAALPNDLTGNGQLHFGLNKNPTDPGADSLRSGFQESGINEAVVYGGIFVEDSASGTVTLQ